jgi:hypothetical protein
MGFSSMTATSRIYSPDAAKHNRFERPAPHRDFMSETFLAMPTVFQHLLDRRDDSDEILMDSFDSVTRSQATLAKLCDELAEVLEFVPPR